MADNTYYKCEWHIKSEPVLVPPVIKEMLSALDDRVAIMPGERDEIKLIFNELLFNAVVHGNNKDTRKRVHIRLTAGSRFVCASITDEGSGFNTAGVVQQSKKDNIEEMESGRGMKLVMALADEVVYTASGRQVTFVKKLGSGAGRHDE